MHLYTSTYLTHPLHQRPQIAQFNGVDWQHFSTNEEAKKCVDEMIAKNRVDFPWITDEKDWASEVNPILCSKFFYVHQEGFLGFKSWMHS